jgi:hypothetical protein
MLSDTKRQVINCKTVAAGWFIYLNCMMMHGSANVKNISLPSILFSDSSKCMLTMQCEFSVE